MNNFGWPIVGVGSAIFAVCLIAQQPSDRAPNPVEVATIASTPAPCSLEAEKDERNRIGEILADHYANKTSLGMDAFDAGNNIMNTEFGCATDAQTGSDQAHHYVLAATGEMFMARAPMDASVKQEHLAGVISSANKALAHGDITDEDRRLANDMKERVQGLLAGT